LALAAVACLWLAGCVAGPAPNRPPEVAHAYEDLDGAAPANLLRASSGPFVGRPIQGTATPYMIHYLLVDARSHEPRYVLATGADPGSYYMVPLSVLEDGPGGVAARANPSAFPSISQTYMEHRFRPAP
jgi:hypothetical protein